MTDEELNLRAGLAAFSDDKGRIHGGDVNKFDPLHSGDDLVRLLIATGISFHRPSNAGIVAWTGDHSVAVKVQHGDELAAAARAACELAASWISDDDVKAWQR